MVTAALASALVARWPGPSTCAAPASGQLQGLALPVAYPGASRTEIATARPLPASRRRAPRFSGIQKVTKSYAASRLVARLPLDHRPDRGDQPARISRGQQDVRPGLLDLPYLIGRPLPGAACPDGT